MKDLRHLPIVNGTSTDKAVRLIVDEWLASQSHKVVNFIYYSNFIGMLSDDKYEEALALSDYILIDGIGMQLYMQIVKGFWPHNLNGTDLNPVLLKFLDEKRIKIALYGTTGKNIKRAAENVSAYLPNGSIYYTQDGYSPLDWTMISDGSVLMIGMGSPLQEKWVAANIAEIENRKLLVVTVGGFFDFASGFYVRAPKLVRTFKLEWAWRTMLHPGRHFKKRLKDLTILWKPLFDKLFGQGKNIKIREI